MPPIITNSLFLFLILIFKTTESRPSTGQIDPFIHQKNTLMVQPKNEQQH